MVQKSRECPLRFDIAPATNPPRTLDPPENTQGLTDRSYRYPKHVWSPAGGWYTQPANWKANTAVFGAVLLGFVAITWNSSAHREHRDFMPRADRFYPSRKLVSNGWRSPYAQECRLITTSQLDETNTRERQGAGENRVIAEVACGCCGGSRKVYIHTLEYTLVHTLVRQTQSKSSGTFSGPTLRPYMFTPFPALSRRLWTRF